MDTPEEVVLDIASALHGNGAVPISELPSLDTLILKPFTPQPDDVVISFNQGPEDDFKPIVTVRRNGDFYLGERKIDSDEELVEAMKQWARSLGHLHHGAKSMEGTVELIDLGIYEVMGPTAKAGGYGGLDTLHHMLSRYDGQRVEVIVRPL